MGSSFIKCFVSNWFILCVHDKNLFPIKSIQKEYHILNTYLYLIQICSWKLEVWNGIGPTEGLKIALARRLDQSKEKYNSQKWLSFL